MATVSFTQNLRRFIDCPMRTADGGTVSEVLTAVFNDNPQLKGYVLDDQGRLRRHMLIAVDGVMICDRVALSDVVRPQSEVYVIQALSGG